MMMTTIDADADVVDDASRTNQHTCEWHKMSPCPTGPDRRICHRGRWSSRARGREGGWIDVDDDDDWGGCRCRRESSWSYLSKYGDG